MPRIFIPLLIIALAPLPASALEVRVDNSKGVPRILVDGQPVRARMFWGAPGSKPLSAKSEPGIISFAFVSPQACDTGTLHFRFGQVPGEVFLDDIRITDLDTNRDILPTFDFEAGEAAFKNDWHIWPPGAQNTVGTVAVEKSAGRDNTAGLHVTLKNPPSGHWPDFHIYHNSNLVLEKDHHYRVSFWLRASPARSLQVAVYRPGPQYENLGGPGEIFTPQIRLAATAGVDFVSFPIGMPWPAPGKPVDWTVVDSSCQRVLAANPRALLIPRVPMDPPAWWRAAHPDEMMTFEDSTHGTSARAVPGEIYVRDASERLAALVKHLEETFPDRIAGYHPCGQNTGEWFYQDTWLRPLNGYAPADAREFRKWLKSRYASDQALQKAWNNPQITLDTAAVPSAKARHAAPSGVLRDPATERDLLDFAQFQQDLMSDCVCSLAKVVRQASAGKKLVLFFYGYGFEFGAIANGAPVCGHYAMRKAINSPDIDLLCSPISYFDRALGQSGPVMSAAESVSLGGKLWLCEDDTSTYLSTGTPPGHKERVKNLDESNHLLARNLAQESLRNYGTWWMDLTASGWFNDPGMWDLMKRFDTIDRATLENPKPFTPEVAAILDEASMLHVAAGGTSVTLPGIYEVRRALGRMGAPYGQYLLDDLVAGKVRAKLYVFLNAWRLSPARREALLAKTRGATVIWCYAPGYFENGKTSLDSMRELTGFTMKKIDLPKALAQPTDNGRKLGLEKSFGRPAAVTPLFAPADAAEKEILAAYPDGSPAVAMRKTANTTSIFVGAPGLSSDLLRLAAKNAGVHLFTQTDANIYANGPFIAIHAAADGPITIDTAHPGPIRDALTNQVIGEGPRITLPMKFGETQILDCR